MAEIGREILPVNIEDELKQSYLDYAMSVIVGRALPDVRDGLKPVHRRVLFAMSELNNTWNRPYMKSARVVGEVIGKYHPHGDSAVYDTIVRMAQTFSMRYLLVDGQGNFGSVDGDPPAAMRYTEVRMAKLADLLLADLDKETVDHVPNYDETLSMPEVLPTRVPNLLVNGSSGIAVGMATNIPPHNLGEVGRACIALIDDEDLTIDDLMTYIQGPDFPTGAIINGRAGIVQAYKTGRGRIYVRARAEVETDAKTGRDTIIIHEIPYMLNKARLIEKIAELVKDKRIEGISELRDESDKDGMRVVIEIRRGESGEVVLNNLYSQTQLQTVFGINCVALEHGQPKVMNLKQMLEAFIRHRREVVTRRTVYLLRKARERGHILEGQAVALSNIDEVIAVIKASPTPAEARDALCKRGWESPTVSSLLARAGAEACRPDGLEEQYGLRDGRYWLSPTQAQAILDLRLNRLTSMEQDKLIEEYQALLSEIEGYIEILEDGDRLMAVIRGELEEVVEAYDDPRRTEITGSYEDLSYEDLINEEDMVVTVSNRGYAKAQPLATYEAQRRGGRGKAATNLNDEDFVEHLLVANSHDTILCFTDQGKVFWLKVYQFPQGTRTSRGRPIVNLLPLGEGERVTTLLPVQENTEDGFIFMATANGTVKKTPIDQFSRPRSVGLIAIDLEPDNHLVRAAFTDGSRDVMLFAASGKAVRFKESDVRAMGRTARGVRGIRLLGSDTVIACIIPDAEGEILTASEHGYGKRTDVSEFPLRGRGAQGVIAMRTSERNGRVVGAAQVAPGEEIMLISNQGTLVRTRVDEVPRLSRATQGVRLINLRDGEHLVGLERIAESDVEDAGTAGDAPDEASGETPGETD
ncbi:MAG: DNA gyrase subunit A [Gammaproteobacteria bacterium]|nr:MAG: DNA gyrase subunit A [Gammaproteobacteria bacterium]